MGHMKKNMNKMLTAALLSAVCGTAHAQEFFANGWNNTGSGDWSTGSNWLLVSGTQDIPSSEFSEFAVINNGGTANVASAISNAPLALFIGEVAGQSGTLNISSGSLSIIADNILTAEFTAAAESRPAVAGTAGQIGRLIVGLGGTGNLNVSGGTLNVANGLTVSGAQGGTGTLMLSGTGIINATAGSSNIGAGGGEAATWTMTGGTFNQVAGDINIADNGGGNATLNMSGGIINAGADLDLAGNGSRAVVNMSGNAQVNTTANTFFGTDNASYLRMNLSDTASLTTGGLNANRGADSIVTFRDQSTLNVTGSLNFASGTIRVEGTQINLSVGTLNLGGRYNPVISSSGTSVIEYTTGATLGGELALEFDGVTPILGDSWTIAHGPSVATGDFNAITGPELGQGMKFEVQQSAGNVDVSVNAALTLKANTVAGTSSIIDYIGGSEITSYVIKSKNGLLDAVSWNSLQDAGASGFEEATPRSEQVSGLNLHESKTFGAGEIHNLGGLIGNLGGALPFGQSLDADEFSLDYFTADGVAHSAILDITALKNTLVLTIDPTTGMAMVQNHSAETIELTSYVVTSTDGSLDVSGWDSLADQGESGWEEAAPTSNQLSELNLEELLVISPGQMIDLSQLMDTSKAQDLGFTFTLNGDESLLDGIVKYANLPSGFDGDLDFDNDVDADDLAIAQNGLGDGYTLADLFNVRNNFGAGSAAVTAIPEPSSLALFGLGAVAMLKRRK